MAGKMCAEMAGAVAVWTPESSVYRIASQHGVNASALYRALKRNGKLRPVRGLEFRTAKRPSGMASRRRK